MSIRKKKMDNFWNRHPGKTCEDHGKSLVKRAGTSASLSAMFGPGNDSVLVTTIS